MVGTSVTTPVGTVDGMPLIITPVHTTMATIGHTPITTVTIITMPTVDTMVLDIITHDMSVPSTVAVATTWVATTTTVAA